MRTTVPWSSTLSMWIAPWCACRMAFAIESHVDWREIEIGGHGDRGSRARREKLGLRRALAFVNALTARGVEPERLRVMTPPFDPKARGSWIEMRVRER